MEELRAIKPEKKEALIRQYAGVMFGKLSITEIIGIKKKRTIVKALCECGNTKEFFLYNLLRKHTKSCGCISLDGLAVYRVKHGESVPGAVSLEYKSYIRMKISVTSKSEKVRVKFKKFDELGITICPRWLDSKVGYQNFLEDMGRKPSKNYMLARINRKEGFSKDNCKWKLREAKTKSSETTKEIERNIKEAWESGDADKFLALFMSVPSFILRG